MLLALTFAAGTAFGSVIGCYAGWAQAHAALERRRARIEAAALQEASRVVMAEHSASIAQPIRASAFCARLLQLADALDAKGRGR